MTVWAHSFTDPDTYARPARVVPCVSAPIVADNPNAQCFTASCKRIISPPGWLYDTKLSVTLFDNVSELKAQSELCRIALDKYAQVLLLMFRYPCIT